MTGRSEPDVARQIIRDNMARNRKTDIGDTGDLDVGSCTPCPNCGEDLGYYAELVNHTTTCDNCGQTFEIKPSEEITWRRIA